LQACLLFITTIYQAFLFAKVREEFNIELNERQKFRVQAATWLRGTRTVRVSTADSGADEAASRHQAGFCIRIFCFLLSVALG
jgi:hypothetical protein